MTITTPRRYGVKRQQASATTIDYAAERLALNGFTLIDGGYSVEQQEKIAIAFAQAYEAQMALNGGPQALRAIDEHNTIRAPLIYDANFIDLATNPNVLALAERVFGGSHETGAYILNQQNGIINPANSGEYNQGAWHRDLPYQHFVSTRPLAINALYCIDPFMVENGATLVVPGSHRQEEFPSDAVLIENQKPVAAPAGSFLVLDCMVYHSGGVNRTDRVRRAVNHVYTLPIIKQQISLSRCISGDIELTSATAKLLGFGSDTSDSPGAYYESRRTRLAKG